MASVIHATAHGFSAGDRIYFGNLVGGDGIEDGRVYYVIAGGLTADDFEFSETDGGAAFVFTADITSGIVSGAAVYTQITDPADTMAPPVAPGPPVGLALTPQNTLDADGHAISTLNITLTQPADATLRQSVVTLTPSVGDVFQVIIPAGQTTAVIRVPANIDYDGEAFAYDIFGNPSLTSTTDSTTSAADTTAPATPFNPQPIDGFKSWGLVWDPNTETDLDHYEVVWRATGVGSYSDPIITYTTRFTFSPAVAAPGTGTVYDVKVRAVDRTGNASAYTAISHPGSFLLDGTDIEDGTITTTEILDGSITTPKLAANSVTAEKLLIQDAFGATVLNANGFGGSWLDFLASGLVYNAFFKSGDTTDIAVTEVAGAATIANYNASAIQAHLPFWVVAASGGTVKIVTDTAAPSGTALEMSGTGSQVNRIYQDIPEAFGVGVSIGVRVTSAFSVAGDKIRIWASFRDANHALLGSRVNIQDLAGPFSTGTTYSATGFVNTFLGDPIHGGLADQPGTRYVRIEFEVTHATAASAIRVGFAVVEPAYRYGQQMAAEVMAASTLDVETTFVSLGTSEFDGLVQLGSTANNSMGRATYNSKVLTDIKDPGAAVGAANMFTGYGAGVTAWAGVALRITGDTKWRAMFTTAADGATSGKAGLQWASGSADPDIYMYRNGAGELRVEGVATGTNNPLLRLVSGATPGASDYTAFGVTRSGDIAARMIFGYMGDAQAAGFAVGSGAAARDIYVYRSGAKALAIDADAGGTTLTTVNIVTTNLQQSGTAVSLLGHGAADHANITRKVFLDAATAKLDSATAANVGASPDLTGVVAYADAATSGALWTFEVPDDWDSGVITLQPVWSPGSSDGTAHTVRWSIVAKAVAAGSTVTAAGTTVTFTGSSAARTAGVVVYDTATSTTLTPAAAGDLFRFTLRRVGADGADTYVGVVNLLGVIVSYTANQ
jgi:hypothetical protein